MLKILQDMYKEDFTIISHEVHYIYHMGHEAMTTFPTNVTQVNMVTGADESGYYTFVEVVFMKEKKEMN